MYDNILVEGSAPTSKIATIRFRLKHPDFTQIRVYVTPPNNTSWTKIFDISGQGQITPSVDTTANSNSDPTRVQTISENIEFTDWEGQWNIRVRDSAGSNDPGELLSWEIIPVTQ